MSTQYIIGNSNPVTLIYYLSFFMILLPLVGGIISLLVKREQKILYPEINNHFKYHQSMSLIISLIILGLSLILLFSLNKSQYQFQGIVSWDFFWKFPLTIGIDFIALTLILLTNLFSFLCILSVRPYQLYGKYNYSETIAFVFFIQFGLLGSFFVADVFWFFVFFEITLAPIYLIILRGGSRERKIRASILIALFTLAGSIFMLYAIILLMSKYGTTDYVQLYSLRISLDDQKILWLCFFLAFAVKIPLFPMHIWLPEAHVEAPTIGSVILAALLLKLGIFGLMRYGFGLFPLGHYYYSTCVLIATIGSFIYASFGALRQTDIKKIIAYSSVIHMNLVVAGLSTFTVLCYSGSVFQMIAHGFVSGGLFFCVGMLYDRFYTRSIWYFGGVVQIFPVLAIFFFLFTLANIGFPTTGNFIGEMLLFMGLYIAQPIVALIATVTMFTGVILSIWCYNRIFFGNIKSFNEIEVSQDFVEIPGDLDKIDVSILTILVFLTFFTGIYSSSILDLIEANSASVVYKASLEIKQAFLTNN
jgi:NADH-quinone oxidoreductase subunit M